MADLSVSLRLVSLYRSAAREIISNNHQKSSHHCVGVYYSVCVCCVWACESGCILFSVVCVCVCPLFADVDPEVR